MKVNQSVTRSLYFAAGLMCLIQGLWAESSMATSTTDVTVNTKGWFDAELVVSMHRLTNEAYKNAGADAGIDEPLTVLPNRDILGRQPEIGLLNHIEHGLGIPISSGLVADGVTPLLFRVSVGAAISEPVMYEIEMEHDKFAEISDLNSRISVLDADGVFRSGTFITLSPEQPDAYFVLGPVAPSEIESNAGGSSNIRLTLRQAGSVWSNWIFGQADATVYFSVAKPPIILVHGYNADDDTWGDAFIDELEIDRRSDFIIRVEYGTIDGNNSFNTEGKLLNLTEEVDFILRRQVEDRESGKLRWAAGNWAWTRYDAVGHSQGGVLMRFLCSQAYTDIPKAGERWRFRQESNANRGRFRRLITIGSPHFGSTIAQLGIGMKADDIKFGSWEKAAADTILKALPKGPTPDEIIANLLQPKFRIDTGGSSAKTPQELNLEFIPDPLSRIHMLGATIDAGLVPGSRPGLLSAVPLVFRALHVPRGDADSEKVDGKTWGEWLAPYGSDGVVDLRSQLASPDPSNPRFNASYIPPEASFGVGGNISHSGPHLVFKSAQSETGGFNPLAVFNADYSLTARTVRILLIDNEQYFGPFPAAAECADLHADMNATALAIEGILERMRFMFVEGGTCHVVLSPDPLISGDEILAAKAAVSGDPAAESLNLALQPPVGESPSGEVTWEVVVYGPDGISNAGITLTPSGTYGENLQVDIASGVVGDVVVFVQFPSVSGGIVVGEAGIIASRPPGVLTGVELRPDMVDLPAGTSVGPLEIWGLYDSGGPSLLFTYTSNTTWTSLNSAVSTVDGDGVVSLIAPGTTTVEATYNGVHVGSATIHVLEPAPEITSADTASASLGEAFSYQITSTDPGAGFGANGLPEGLSLDLGSGLVGGTPAYEGLFYFTVSATNADGQVGSLEVELSVTGTDLAPTSLGLIPGSAPALQASGTVAGQLDTVDPNPLDSFTYELVAGSGDTDNGLFVVNGDELVTSAVIDPAIKPECAIRLRSTDSGGLSVERSLTLPVLGPPEIISNPGDSTTFSGREIVLQVVAEGREPLSYQWLEEGAVITGATARVLGIPAGMPGARSFSVQVTNEYGSVTSLPATVTVAPVSFDAWAAPYLGAASDPILPEDDLNGDGVINFFDYIFGTSPDVTRSVMPHVQMTPSGPAFVYRRAVNIEPRSYEILTTSDFSGWSPYVVPAGDQTITPVDAWSNEHEILLPEATKLFLKLEVEE